MSNSRKSFRIPVMVGLILALILVVSGASFAYAKYSYSDEFSGKVQILTDNLGVFKDQACTIPFDSTVTLDFGEFYPGGHSTILDLFCSNKSDGESYIKPQMSVSSLPVGVSIFEQTYGRIPVQPDWLNLYVPESLTYTPTGLTGQVGYANVEANATQMWVSINGMPSSSYIKVDNEIMRYTFTDTTDRWTLKGLERGLCGTTPAMHERASTITWISTPSYIALDCLALNEVQKISLMVNTTDEVVSGEITFDVLVQASSDH